MTDKIQPFTQQKLEVWLKITPAIADSCYYGPQTTVCPEGVWYNENWLY